MSIQIQGIGKHFGNFEALGSVSLEIKSGELISLLGPSGSGKTTLLRILAGLEIPDANGGKVFFNGHDVTQLSPRDRKVGLVFQHYALFKHMNVFQNVSFGLRILDAKERPSSGEIRNRVKELLKLVQLEGLEGRYPAQLSGGQRQRVGLARALAVSPDVLLMDEPFGALDAQVRKELRQWLRKLHHEINLTTIFVTHDQEEALAISDRVVVMHQGKIQQVSSPEEIYHKPATPFVFGFLGSVNVFKADSQNGYLKIGAAHLDHPLPQDGRVTVFVRPHQLALHREASIPDYIPAQITEVNSAGSFVRIFLRTSLASHLVEVELTHEEFLQKKFAVGETAFIEIKSQHVFSEDFSI